MFEALLADANISKFGVNTRVLNCCVNYAFFHRNLEDTSIPIYSAKAHKEIINCIDGVGGLSIGHGAPEIVTGSRDGKLRKHIAG